MMPGATVLLERLCDLYIREQWTHPTSADHPQHTGELQELPDLWKQLHPHLFWGLLRYYMGLSRWHDVYADALKRSLPCYLPLVETYK
jgi:hypothetical protein